jgi:hypothetical protein
VQRELRGGRVDWHWRVSESVVRGSRRFAQRIS